MSFNPRRRAGRDAYGQFEKIPGNGFQSTRPRRGATVTLSGFNDVEIVSIHAPARGATL